MKKRKKGWKISKFEVGNEKNINFSQKMKKNISFSSGKLKKWIIFPLKWKKTLLRILGN